MSRFEPYSPEFLADPYPTYARLRDETPVFHDDRWGLTFVARHADVTAILRDRRFGRDPRGVVPAAELDPALMDRLYPSRHPDWTRLIRGSFIDLDPPRHTRIRRLVQHAFTRRATESHRADLEATAARALEPALARGGMEAIADFATPVPLTLISGLLGVPPADQPRLVDWSHAVVRLFDEGCTPAEGDAAEAAVREFEEYVETLLAERVARPRDDLATALLQAETDGGRLTREEVVATCILVLNAGHEATVQAIGNALLALAADQAAFRRLRSSPGLAARAADELLRFDTPLQMFERWVLEDLTWDGRDLHRGSKVGLLFGSANRDPHVFTDPERLDLSRSPNPHVSFGGGVHHCVGAPLALLELEVALRALAERVEAFTVDHASVERVPSLVFRGTRRLAVAFG